jgi:hypothetical protein
MPIKIQVKPQKTTVSSVSIGKTANLSLQQISNLEVPVNIENGYVLAYDDISGKFVFKPVPPITGGTF